MSRTVVVVALLWATSFAPLERSSAQVPPPPRTIPELESRIRNVLESTHTPGISIAVVSRDSVMWQAGLGLADLASGREATSESLFRVGSTSKTFTALLVLLLEQEGTLHLDDPIRRYVPESTFKNAWESTDPVRIVNVLEHAAGWDDWSLRVFASNDSTPLTLRQGLDLDPRGRTSRWRPGTRVSYTNWGPPVAAYIVESVTNRPFEQLVHDRLFAPIGMKTATFWKPSPEAQAATLYHRDGTTPFPYWHDAGRPSGSINASAKDMAAYVRFLLNRGVVNGRQLLPAAAMERLELPRSSLTARAGLPVGYGLFLGTYTAGGFVWVGHNGNVPGGLTMVAYRPDAGVGYAFMINSSNEAAEREIDALVRAYLTVDEPRPTPAPAAPISALARAGTGWYVVDNPRWQRFYFLDRMLGVVRVQADDSTLILDPVLGEALHYVPVSETLFRAPDEPVATLALVDDAADGRPSSWELVVYILPISLRRISPAAAYLTVGLGGAFCLTTVASLAFGFAVFLVGVFRKRGYGDQVLSVSPFIAASTVVACFVILNTSREDAFTRFGEATAWSISLFACITLFAVSSVIGLVMAARSPLAARRPIRLHALVAGVINVIVVAYLAWWGVLGWRIWA
jgi:CubicO group peptidase (beta-lactamase class C family)